MPTTLSHPALLRQHGRTRRSHPPTRGLREIMRLPINPFLAGVLALGSACSGKATPEVGRRAASATVRPRDLLLPAGAEAQLQAQADDDGGRPVAGA
jgi:hypothetical protein